VAAVLAWNIRSWTAIVETSAVSLNIEMFSDRITGICWRRACGTMMWRNCWNRLSRSILPASICSTGTAWKPLR
jgi:hypothetical protein